MAHYDHDHRPLHSRALTLVPAKKRFRGCSQPSRSCTERCSRHVIPECEAVEPASSPPEAAPKPSEGFRLFGRLPREIRQKIFFETVPKEERLIKLNAVTITCRMSACDEKGHCTPITRMVGADTRAANVPKSARSRPIQEAFNYFIEPAETQRAIANLCLVNREAKAVTQWVYPDTLRLGLVPDGCNCFRDLLKSLAKGLRNLLVPGWENGRASTIYLRCSLDHDIFHVLSISRHTYQGQAFPDYKPYYIERLLDGMGFIRSMTRVALPPDEFATATRRDTWRRAASKESWSMKQLVQLSTAIPNCACSSRRGPDAGLYRIQTGGLTTDLCDITPLVTFVKNLATIWGGALLACAERVRPFLLWQTTYREVYGLFLKRKIGVLEFMEYCEDWEEDVLALGGNQDAELVWARRIDPTLEDDFLYPLDT